MGLARWLAFPLLANCVSLNAARNLNTATPLGKVVELLDVLKEHLDEDTLKDGDTYAKFAEMTVAEIASEKQVIKETKEQISTLQTTLDEENASREQKKLDLEAAGNELTKAEKDLKDAQALRDEEHKVFLKNEAVFEESIDQLSRSVEVLAKRFQDQSGSAGAGSSLLSVATKLKHTLEDSKDIALSMPQRDLLNEFFRMAKHRGAPHPLSFLQMKDEPAEYGEYQSQSSPVVETLNKVMDKTKENKEAAMEQEEKAVADFKTVEGQLKEQISTCSNRMEELKQQIAESEQRSSELTANLLAAKELLQSTEKHLELLQADFQSKTRSFKQRALKRSDELTAVKEGIRVLTSETAKYFMTRQSIGTPEGVAPAPAAPAFLQTSEHRSVMGQAHHLLKTVTNSGLVLLAMQAQTRSYLADGEDPFEKVKSMIKDMLEKLMSAANKDAEHNAFCESEMTKSTESHASKSADLQKLSDKLTFIASEIERLTDEISDANRELNDMKEAMTAASQIRETEKSRATQAIADYSSAQTLLKQAVGVLNKFYSAKAIEADTASTDGSDEVHGEKNREGLGHGVVAILEIAIQDFTDLEVEARQEERKAEKMFKDLTLETRIRTAQFSKDVEFKSRSKIKLEGEQARSEADLKSYEKELEAVTEYLEQLKAQCVAKVDPYEVRKARREKELEGLKEALTYLTGEE
jgi:flagellar biosynthesis chaperone FliJ